MLVKNSRLSSRENETRQIELTCGRENTTSKQEQTQHLSLPSFLLMASSWCLSFLIPSLPLPTGYLKKVTTSVVKLDSGGGEAAASSSEVQTATSSTTFDKSSRSPDKSPSSHHRRPRSKSPQFRSESVTSPTSTCPTIASALWKPIWPPGWYPSSPSRSQTSSPSHRTSTPDSKRPHSSTAGGPVQIPTPPVITMSRPNDGPSRQQQKESTAGQGVADTTSTISTDEDRPKTPIDESEAMEAWLDEHPSFLHSYVVRKASRAIVDAWLQARTSHSGMGSASAPVSGSTTPVRKISAHEFEKCSLFLPPMVSTTSDGTPTFLPVTPSEGGGSSQDVTSRPPRKSRQELRGW